MKPKGLSSNALSIALRVPVTRINDIVLERRAITADTALRLARYFKTTPEFWLHLQVSYDLARTANESGADIERMIEPRADATPAVESAVTPENNRLWTRIVAKAWADETYKKRLLADPGAVAAEEGLTVPPGVILKVVEAAKRQAWLVLPPKPAEDATEKLEARLAATIWPF